MTRKSKEAPLNLIRILPPNERSPQSSKHNPAQTHFKIQLDDHEPEGPVPSYGRVMLGLRATKSVFGKIGQLSLKQIKRALHFGGWLARVIARRCGLSVLKVGRAIGLFLHQGLDLILSLGGWIRRSTKQDLRTRKGDIKGERKPPVIDSLEKARSRQRELLIEEVHVLRQEVCTHEDELKRLTAQLGELKALLLSQQQVILHLGKELEATEMKERPSEKGTIRRPKTRSTKSSKPKEPESPESPLPTPFELTPPHH